MDLTEALRGEDISRTDFFDFVVAPDVEQSALHFNRALKSMGIFVEEAAPVAGGGGGGGGGAPPPKEANNNHVGGEGWSAAASERDAVRLETAILEDLNRFCWDAGPTSPQRAPNDTDGAIYTLTVLNGGEHACAWYRPPEGPPAPQPPPPPPPPPPQPPTPPALPADDHPASYPQVYSTPVDIDCLLGVGVGQVGSPHAPSPHPPPPCVEPSLHFPLDARSPPPPASPPAPAGESLLRSALQGRPFGLRFGPSAAPPEGTSCDPVDDLLLSQLDAASFPEDFEKLKRIAHEVAESVSHFCLEQTPAAAPGAGTTAVAVAAAAATVAAATTAATTAPNARSRKNGGGQAKRPARCPAAPGARKERSLHYCGICSKGFKDKYSVNVHIRTHTGEKPFACSLCGKSFRQKAHLAKHYQTHLAAHKSSTGAGSAAGGAAGTTATTGRRPNAPAHP